MTLWLTNIDLGAFLFVAPVREWAICQGGGKLKGSGNTR